MGYHIEYTLKLKISKKNKKRALEIFNHLHSDEMLATRGGYFYDPISKQYYSVSNPSNPDYKTLTEAFENWGIAGKIFDVRDEEGHAFMIEGTYGAKIGEQVVLLSNLAPVLKNTVIYVYGEEDDEFWAWVIEDGQFYEKDLTVRIKRASMYESSDEEDDEEDEISL